VAPETDTVDVMDWNDRQLRPPTASAFERLRDDVEGAHPEVRSRLRDWMDEAFDNARFHRAIPVDHVCTEPVVLEGRTHTDVRRKDVFWLSYSAPPPRRLAGVYAFASECDWLYLGFSCDLISRRTSHTTPLRHHKHPNQLLQRYWDKGGPMWFVILETIVLEKRIRQGQHPAELQWKRRLRPICDRESRNTHISLFFDPVDHPVNGSPSWTWAGGPPTLPRSTSKSWGLPS
jgi:hypothetical protein